MNITEKIDWLSITFPTGTKLSEIVPNGCTVKRVKSPIPVYDVCYETEPFKMKVMFSKHERLGVHCIISGKPLTELNNEGITVQSIYDGIKRLGGKIGRIDIAVDIIGSNVSVEDFEIRAYDRVCTLEGSTGIFTDKNSVETLYLGNPKSKDQKLRIYNKGVEQKMDIRWTRIEYEKRKRADNLADRLFGKKTASIRGVIKSVLDYPHWAEYREIMNIEATPIMRGENDAKNSEYVDKLDWLVTSVAPALAKLMISDSIQDDCEPVDTLSFKTFLAALNASLIGEMQRHKTQNSLLNE